MIFRVALNNVIKVADFGLSIYMPENKDYFRLSDDEKLPVKWMAVESLADHKFSEASDVVSSVTLLILQHLSMPVTCGFCLHSFILYVF